jgi:hypothetical protein
MFNTSTSFDQIMSFSALFKATSTASVTFDVTAQAATGTCSVFGGNGTTQLTVQDIGPYGAPA